jgi:hypothetical protein
MREEERRTLVGKQNEKGDRREMRDMTDKNASREGSRRRTGRENADGGEMEKKSVWDEWKMKEECRRGRNGQLRMERPVVPDFLASLISGFTLFGVQTLRLKLWFFNIQYSRSYLKFSMIFCYSLQRRFKLQQNQRYRLWRTFWIVAISHTVNFESPL